MKKSVFLLGAVSVVAAVQFFAPVVSAAVGSWSVNGNNMYYSDGAVTVGSTSPLKAGISIQGTANDHNAIGVTSHHEVGNPSFIGYRSRGTNLSPLPVAKDDFVGGLLGRGYDGTDYRNAAGIRFQVAETPSASNMPGNISFWTRGVNAANFEEKMRLSHTGNLGIGTNSPEKMVHLYKQGGGDEVRVQSEAVTYGMGLTSTNNAGFLYTRTNHPIYFGTNNAQRMVVSETGNVGIGTPTPSAKLDVIGAVKWNNSMLSTDQGGAIELGGNNSVAGTGMPFVDFHHAGKTEDYSVRMINHTPRGLSLSIPSTNEKVDGVSIDVGSFQTDANVNQSTYFRVTDIGSGSTPFIIRASGNVGIGDSNPQYKLAVQGSVCLGQCQPQN